jgi:hypothetical protein
MDLISLRARLLTSIFTLALAVIGSEIGMLL